MSTNVKKNRVSLLVNGFVNDQWEIYDIDSDLMIPADSWRVAIGFKNKDFSINVHPGDDVIVQVDGITVMTGYVDELEYNIAADTRVLELSGRDKASLLVDCSAPIATARELTLNQVIDLIVKPFGYSKIKIGQSDLTTKKIHINPGETAWAVLESAAQSYGMAVWFDPDGTLVISEPDYTVPVSATLLCNADGAKNNVLSMKVSRSEASSYGEITVLGQSAGFGGDAKNTIKSIATDPNIRSVRKLIIVDGDCETASAATSAAEKAIADARLDALTISVDVKGHYASEGVLWEPGQRIAIQSDLHGLEGVYFLMSRRFNGDNASYAKTTLTLKEDGVWITPMRDEKKSTRSGRSNANKPLGIIDVS